MKELRIGVVSVAFITALVLGVCVYGNVSTYQPPEMALWVNTDDIYKGVDAFQVSVHGWVVGAGGNQHGRWFDLLEYSESLKDHPRTIRIYHKFNTQFGRDDHVVVVGQVPEGLRGRLYAVSVTVDRLWRHK